jgi:hypothetical protein
MKKNLIILSVNTIKNKAVYEIFSEKFYNIIVHHKPLESK